MFVNILSYFLWLEIRSVDFHFNITNTIKTFDSFIFRFQAYIQLFDIQCMCIPKLIRINEIILSDMHVYAPDQRKNSKHLL